MRHASSPVYHVCGCCQVTAVCPAGFEFAQQEHAGENSVSMTCEPGGWSVRQTPQCEPVWCGQAPLLENGFYLSSTGAYASTRPHQMNVNCCVSRSNSVVPMFEISYWFVLFLGSRNGESVTYGCYDGFTLVGAATITCQASGQWTIGPSCQASICPQLTGTDGRNSRSHLETFLAYLVFIKNENATLFCNNKSTSCDKTFTVSVHNVMYSTDYFVLCECTSC